MGTTAEYTTRAGLSSSAFSPAVSSIARGASPRMEYPAGTAARLQRWKSRATR
jgi:hypothetical protein